MTDGRILFIDAYDSFSNNIVALLTDHLPVTVAVIKIDDPRFVFNDDAFHSLLNDFDAVVAGPGPGHPADVNDVGLIGKLWYLPEQQQPLVLGICLGFQNFCLAYGASAQRLHEPRHGLITPVTHCNRDIFTGTGDVRATQYHSLHIRLRNEQSVDHALWAPSRSCRELVPLAWDLSDPNNGPILMAARHCHKPLWGVQYHPESICTNAHGQQLISKWWQEVCAWNDISRRSHAKGPLANNGVLLQPVEGAGSPQNSESAERSVHTQVQWTKVDIDTTVDVVDIIETLPVVCEPMLLESGTRNGHPVNPETGRFSIVGFPDRLTNSLHSLDECELFMQQHCATGGSPDVPFWGGLIGYVSYEAGLQTIHVPTEVTRERPRVWLSFVQRSIVIDHITRTAYVQSIAKKSDDQWICSTAKAICELTKTCNPSPCATGTSEATSCILYEPDKDDYSRKVLKCQSHLRAGSSYELCLTDQTRVQCFADPRKLYQKLRRSNPAPFGAYMSLKPEGRGGVDIISSSPERFLSWSRNGTCQFRPIKGTVKKTPGMTRAKAEELLGSAKERAENLMIVDLIRHDLNGVPSVENVRVPKLMVVEEYETVFQLVSVIEGDVKAPGQSIAALKASLPPGSMTGAPKKRSCELLTEIEGREPRGLYSGVIGYFDVGGGGDFSVVIRSAFKWSNEPGVWRIGAGGAVTALSEPEAEWEEMLAKREGVLNVFR